MSGAPGVHAVLQTPPRIPSDSLPEPPSADLTVATATACVHPVPTAAWGAGVTLLGYLLGQIAFIRDNVDLIFILIVFVSVVPIIIEVGKRLLASRRAPIPVAEAPVPQDDPTP